MADLHMIGGSRNVSNILCGLMTDGDDGSNRKVYNMLSDEPRSKINYGDNGTPIRFTIACPRGSALSAAARDPTADQRGV
jgi:hypothetical protein